MTWCRSAVRRSFGFLVAACRIRSAACDTLARPCVRRVLWLPGFPLAAALLSSDSAGAGAPLFAPFIDTMTASDCFASFVISSDFSFPFAAPARLPGRSEALPGPLCGFTRVHGFLDTAEPCRPHDNGRPVLPSTAVKVSALRKTPISMLTSPAHAHRYRHFTWHLTVTSARLAAKVARYTFLSAGLAPAIHTRVSLAYHRRRSAAIAPVFMLAQQTRQNIPRDTLYPERTLQPLDGRGTKLMKANLHALHIDKSKC